MLLDSSILKFSRLCVLTVSVSVDRILCINAKSNLSIAWRDIVRQEGNTDRAFKEQLVEHRKLLLH